MPITPISRRVAVSGCHSPSTPVLGCFVPFPRRWSPHCGKLCFGDCSSRGESRAEPGGWQPPARLAKGGTVQILHRLSMLSTETRPAPAAAQRGRADDSAASGKPSETQKPSPRLPPPELLTLDSSRTPAPFLAEPSPRGCNRPDAGLRLTGGPEDRLPTACTALSLPIASPC